MLKTYRFLAYLICALVGVQAASHAWGSAGIGKYVADGGVIDKAAWDRTVATATGTKNLDGKTVLNISPSYIIVSKTMQTDAESFLAPIQPVSREIFPGKCLLPSRSTIL